MFSAAPAVFFSAHLDAVFLQDLHVALAEFGVGALVLDGRENDPARRRRVEQPVGDAEQCRGEDDEGRGGRGEVAEREQGGADAGARMAAIVPAGAVLANAAAILAPLCAFSSSKTIA